MKTKPIISILNLKHGVGCSTLVWNIAHLLELDIFEHEKALHSYFASKRADLVDDGQLDSKINVYRINKRKFDAGVYDLGADFNYPYVKQLLKKSDVIIVPVENSYEVLAKSIATLKHIHEIVPDTKIFVVFNRLDNNDSNREMNYTNVSIDTIKEHLPSEAIQFFYMRYSFAMYKNLQEGFYFLDNFVNYGKTPQISHFNMLQNLRYHTIDKMLASKQKKKAEKEKGDTDFFDKYKDLYEKYTSMIDFNTIYDLKYNEKNKKLIKDMLILTTNIRDTYTLRYKDEN